MGGFESWDEFNVFQRAVERNTRYVLGEREQRFIEEVKNTSEKRRRVIENQRIVWRAQVCHTLTDVHRRKYRVNCEGCVCDEDLELVGQVCTACGAERMIPWQDRALEGRINPKGIPCLYVAEDKDTAMGEMRPWIGTRISLARFRTARNLSVVDCSLDYEQFCQYSEEPGPAEKEKAVWSAINEAFSTPASLSDHTAEYAPTQFLAEVFRAQGYDGVRYKSSLGKGFNLAFFDVGSAEFLTSTLHRLKDVSYEFVDDEMDDILDAVFPTIVEQEIEESPSNQKAPDSV